MVYLLNKVSVGVKWDFGKGEREFEGEIEGLRRKVENLKLEEMEFDIILRERGKLKVRKKIWED